MEKLPIEVKQIIHADEADNSYYVMTCINTIPCTSNTLKKLMLYKSVNYSYIQIEFIEKEEIINNIFRSYVESLLKDINHPEVLQEWKFNLDTAAYEKIYMLMCINLLLKGN